MSLTRVLAIGAVLAALAGGSAQATVVLFDTTISAGSLVAAIKPSSGGPAAQSFNTGGIGGTVGINYVALDIKATAPGDGGSFIVTLNADSGSNTPGASLLTLGTVLDSSLTTTAQLIKFSGTDLIDLASNTQYWIEATQVGASPVTSAQWILATGAVTGPGAAGNFIYKGGVSFADSSSHEPLVMTVDAPEPMTLAVLGVGLAGLGWARRRKVTSKV